MQLARKESLFKPLKVERKAVRGVMIFALHAREGQIVAHLASQVTTYLARNVLKSAVS